MKKINEFQFTASINPADIIESLSDEQSLAEKRREKERAYYHANKEKRLAYNRKWKRKAANQKSEYARPKTKPILEMLSEIFAELAVDCKAATKWLDDGGEAKGRSIRSQIIDAVKKSRNGRGVWP